MRKKVYIAGPMRGIKNYNFDAFFEAEKALEGHYIVTNPARLDMMEGFVPSALPENHNWDEAPKSLDFKRIFIRDLIALSKCDAIYMLKGYENSVGALTELSVALTLRLEIIYQ